MTQGCNYGDIVLVLRNIYYIIRMPKRLQWYQYYHFSKLRSFINYLINVVVKVACLSDYQFLCNRSTVHVNVNDQVGTKAEMLPTYKIY